MVSSIIIISSIDIFMILPLETKLLYRLILTDVSLRVKNLSRKRQNLSKIVAMIGGFLILTGIILLGLTVLTILGYLNTGMLLENKYLPMFAIAMVAIGLLDTIAAVVIARW